MKKFSKNLFFNFIFNLFSGYSSYIISIYENNSYLKIENENVFNRKNNPESFKLLKIINPKILEKNKRI